MTTHTSNEEQQQVLRCRMVTAVNEWRLLDRRCAEHGLPLAHPQPARPLTANEQLLLTDRDLTWLTYLAVRDAFAALCVGPDHGRETTLDSDPPSVAIDGHPAMEDRSRTQQPTQGGSS